MTFRVPILVLLVGSPGQLLDDLLEIIWLSNRELRTASVVASYAPHLLNVRSHGVRVIAGTWAINNNATVININ